MLTWGQHLNHALPTRRLAWQTMGPVGMVPFLPCSCPQTERRQRHQYAAWDWDGAVPWFWGTMKGSLASVCRRGLEPSLELGSSSPGAFKSRARSYCS
jgi:hypothetical protein